VISRRWELSSTQKNTGQFIIFFGSPPLAAKGVRGMMWFSGQFVYTLTLIIFLSGSRRAAIRVDIRSDSHRSDC
jgi:hypothetical protein